MKSHFLLLVAFCAAQSVSWAQPASHTPILPPLTPWSGNSEKLVVPDDHPWQTPSEATGLAASPSYDETFEWLGQLVASSPDLNMISIGRSGEQRDIWMVIAAKGGAATPEALEHNGKPTLLAHAGIHSGEIDGKDAGLMFLRDLTVTGRLDLLDESNFLFIPILSVDGHERSSKFGRINQRGPTEMGWRANRRNLNLNRDFTKVETQEVEALIKTMNRWNPDLYLDLHVTDGADYQYDVTYGYNGPNTWSPHISAWLDSAYRPFVNAALEAQGHIPGPLTFAFNNRDMEDGNVGWTALPRFSTGYSDARHLPHVLLENHSLKPFRQRVLGTYVFLQASLQALISGHESLARAADADRMNRPDSAALAYSMSPGPNPLVPFKGVRSEVFDSEISGGKIARWTGELYVADLPVHQMDVPTSVTPRPSMYYIPAAWGDIAERLLKHGVVVDPVTENQTVQAQMYRLKNAKMLSDPLEGRARVNPGKIVSETRELILRPGSFMVSTDQDLGNLVMLLLEPASPDSYFQWGYFLEVLQRTEYAEDYAMEPMARAMLDSDPDLRAAFEQRIATDSVFASSPAARLTWFYEKTPFFDEEWRLYPIGRSLE